MNADVHEPAGAGSPAAEGCEGGCPEHRGPVRWVDVWSAGSHWAFRYCEAAAAEDRRRGLHVETDHDCDEG